ncbi:AAA family ATPase [Phototrophicus methaneseepsis]|uniref:AAA family ATPase n=1 Tax=Phototrophicus methaneseepsis TaxID=2710758 RepID=A0A7S8IGK6_9CHLR|nr:DnaB-like helicase C-terminal domain-containing protein [Phototrophicus methaneseepsis]QPC84886.1 AAA family ATPase [Phototrophicus methaneseepsis]
MSTRRFTDELPDPMQPASDNNQTASAPRSPAIQPAPGRRTQATKREGAHLPRTLTQVINEADEKVMQGDLVDYVPLATSFDPLDGLIGGGLRKTELTLLGGAQGIGKTIATLQIARNIAMRPDQYAFYLSYEHTEAHLMHRLLCLESVNPPEMEMANSLKLRDLYNIIVSQRAKKFMGRNDGSGSLQAILRDHPKTIEPLKRVLRYSDRLIMLKASPAVTNLRAIKEMTARLADATGGNVTVFVDYLQKIAVHPERPRDENDKVTIIVEGLKDIALSLDVPVFSIVAADREGLKSKRIHLYHLRGSSALDYESDIAIIMNNKYQILAKDHVAFNPYNAKAYRNWVVFTVEKNRAGRAMVDVEFQLHGQHFAFNPRGQRVQQQLIDDKVIET